MLEIILGGYKSNESADQQVKSHFESLGYRVRTYNKVPGLAEFTDISASANGVENIVNMSEDIGRNYKFHQLICGVAGDVGATVSRRPGEEKTPRVILLAGYKSTKPEDQEVKVYYEGQGHTVKTYNKIPGLAESTDIHAVADRIDEVVNMARVALDNRDFHRLCARVAGENGAILSKRPKME